MSLISKLGKTATGLLLTAGLMVSTAIPAGAAEYTKENPLKVALVVHGNLGDKSFFDSAAAGLKQAEAELPISVKIIEAGMDRSKWEPALDDAADSGYDVIITGTFEMIDFVARVAGEYPEEKFISFDAAPDYAACGCENVLGLMYQTSSAGYLAGFASAKLSKTGTLATIIGADFPTVTDFRVGFDQGAKAANPNVVLLTQDAGTFTNPAKGKEIALAQIGQGADVIFPIAGGTGIGALQAVKDSGKLAVGVDSDQAAIFEPTDPAQAAVIFTSVEKKIGQSLLIALKGTIDGSQAYGKSELLGLKEGAVGISKNKFYDEIVPADLRAEIDALEQKIASGEIVVDTLMK